MNERSTMVRDLLGRISRLEIIVGAIIAAVMLVLVIIEPDILQAPFQNWRTIVFTLGGTALAAIALIVMLRLRIPPAARMAVLLIPFAVVNWWLISPYFVDDVVDETFSASISDQITTTVAPEPTTTSAPPDTSTTSPPSDSSTTSSPTTTIAAQEPTTSTTTTAPPVPSGPVLLGAGEFVGLAGHSGTGDAGLFQNPDSTLVLRFENFDIQNGPDLEVYLVPGADQTNLAAGSIHLGALKGNVGDQNYELPDGTDLAPGSYTALVWCEAFSVEFVGATIEV